MSMEEIWSRNRTGIASTVHLGLHMSEYQTMNQKALLTTPPSTRIAAPVVAEASGLAT